MKRRVTMRKMRRIVQNDGFRAVKIYLFDVKHAQMFSVVTDNRRAFGRIWRRRSRLVGATRGGSVGALFASRRWVGLCVAAISPLQSLYLREALSRNECGGSFEGVRSAAWCLIGCAPGSFGAC